jgi:hypothetical protein
MVCTIVFANVDIEGQFVRLVNTSETNVYIIDEGYHRLETNLVLSQWATVALEGVGTNWVQVAPMCQN